MPNYCGEIYISRKGQCMSLIGEKIIDLGLAETIQNFIPSTFGKPLTETQMMMPFISYKDLPTVVRLIGYANVIDMYRAAGINVTIPERFTEIYDKVKTWKDENLDKLTAMILNGKFCVCWWTNLVSPADKLRGIIQNQFSSRERHDIEYGTSTQEVMRVYRHPFNALSLDAIPDVADRLDVSLRWMLGQDKDAMIYSDRASVENLYDAFMLLPSERRKIIDMILDGGETGD